LLKQKRIRDYSIKIGNLPTGEKNSITDIKGVRVGHTTIHKGDINTGVTAIIPHEGDIFREKLMAAVHVINGFGKSTGLIQIEELGTLETPILLTNTFGVGTCVNQMIKYMLNHNSEIGKTTGTVNPIVFECNDSYLNDIRGMHVTENDASYALSSASIDFKEGSVGAGSGMSCYKLKGGIGSASRIVEIDNKKYTVGILVLTNMGLLEELIVGGEKTGQKIEEIKNASDNEADKGSLIIIIATDIPMSSRQLKRIARRAETGVSRTGNTIANGSGEIAIAFSTAQRLKHEDKDAVLELKILNEEKIDKVFTAVGECSEEAVLNSMITAEKTTGIESHNRDTLADYIHLVKKKGNV
jgi:D-aminopeptidase